MIELVIDVLQNPDAKLSKTFFVHDIKYISNASSSGNKNRNTQEPVNDFNSLYTYVHFYKFFYFGVLVF